MSDTLLERQNRELKCRTRVVRVDKAYMRWAQQLVWDSARYYAKEQAWDRGLENAKEARA